MRSRPVRPHRKGACELFESLADDRVHAAAIGITSPAAAALADAAAEARAAYDARQQGHNAALAATQRFNNALERLHSAPGLGADLIQTIKTHAEVTADPGVYTLALLPPPPAPAAPGSRPAPGAPFAFAVALRDDGSLQLTWKCRHGRNASGIMYEVRQRADGGRPEFLATAGRRTFRDGSLPRRAGEIFYAVTPVRSTGRGKPGVFVVSVGVVGGRAGERRAAA